jgi:radical SAM superfamily enzyme YgiQ (UPF0313 family)
MRIFFARVDSEIPTAPVPLGLMALAAYVQKHRSGDELRIYDGRIHRADNDQLCARVVSFKPDLLCITGLSLEANSMHELAGLVKRALPRCKIFMGGPHATSDPKRTMADPNVDLAFIGEGERSFLAVLNALEAGTPFESTKGIAFRRDGILVNNGYPDLLENLDELPWPAWDLMDLEFYFSQSGKHHMMSKALSRRRGVSLFSTRGCPYRCTYCHNVFGKMLRQRSPENVVGELKMLQNKYGVEEVEFLDDIFNLDMKRAADIFDALEREKLRFCITFPNGLRAEFLTDELLRKFKKGGVTWITIAIESGSPRIQKEIRKNIDLLKAQENITRIGKAGINCNGYFMLGFMDETEEEILQTIDFAVKSRLSVASFFILTPYPNTEIYNAALQAGIDMSAQYRGLHEVSVNLSKVSKERLWQLKKLAYRRFYFSFKRLYLLLRANPFKIGIRENVRLLTKMALTGREFKPKPLHAGNHSPAHGRDELPTASENARAMR